MRIIAGLAAAGYNHAVSGAERLQRVQALVLRVEPLGERDRLVKLFSAQRGSIAARATSALELNSRLAPRLMPPHLGSFMLVSGRSGLPIVAGAEIASRFSHWRSSGDRVVLCSLLLAVLDDLRAPPETNAQFWQLAVNLLRNQPVDRSLVSLLALFLHRSLELLGLAGDARCALCDRLLAPPQYSVRSRTYALAAADFSTFICRRCFNRKYGSQQVDATKVQVSDLALLARLRRCPLLDYPKLALRPRQAAFVLELFRRRAQDMLPETVAMLAGVAAHLEVPAFALPASHGASLAPDGYN